MYLHNIYVDEMLHLAKKRNHLGASRTPNGSQVTLWERRVETFKEVSFFLFVLCFLQLFIDRCKNQTH